MVYDAESPTLNLFKKPPPPPPSLSDRIRSAVTRPATPPPPPPRKTERAKRDSVYRQATLVLGDGERMSVVVKDVSATGARVEFFVRRTLPDEVLFLEATMRLRKRARVIWQRDGAVGLAFLD